MKKNNKINLLRHSFWGNFDTGVIYIFLSFLIWEESKDMLAIAIAFIIPVIINTIIDYYFSNLSDRYGRLSFIIIGNIGSSIFLSLYGLSSGLYILYLLIFMKSLFAKLYNTSLSPFIRENIAEDEYKEFIASLKIRISVGASIGGAGLMTLYGFTQSIELIFIVSGLIELFSTVYLLMLREEKHKMKKQIEEDYDNKYLREISIIYGVEAFAIALIVNRVVIFLHDYHLIEIHYVGFVFFLAYGISNILAANIYGYFKRLKIKDMLVLSFALQAILLIVFAGSRSIYLAVFAFFLYELANNIRVIYTSDRLNRSLFTNIGKRLSKFRITIALGSILGQLIISQIWNRLGFAMTFYFSSLVLFILALVLRKKQLSFVEEED